MMVDVEVLRTAAPHICWNEVGCDKHFCSLDKGHPGDCFSLHLSPCTKHDEKLDIKEIIRDHFNIREDEGEDEEFTTVQVHQFTDDVQEHTCERLLEKENYKNYYMIVKTTFGWTFKTGMESHIIFNCPYCGKDLGNE